MVGGREGAEGIRRHPPRGSSREGRRGLRLGGGRWCVVPGGELPALLLPGVGIAALVDFCLPGSRPLSLGQGVWPMGWSVVQPRPLESHEGRLPSQPLSSQRGQPCRVVVPSSALAS